MPFSLEVNVILFYAPSVTDVDNFVSDLRILQDSIHDCWEVSLITQKVLYIETHTEPATI